VNPAADLLIVGGRVFEAFGPGQLGPYGSDIGPRPIATPTAVAVVGDRIAWVGRDEEARRDWQGPSTTVVDARGGLITAGFDDAHIHLLSGAEELEHVDLFQLESVEAIDAAIRAYARADPDGAWVRGRGWMYMAFPGGLPTRELLDRAVPDRPAVMGCYDGHTAWANTMALQAAGIDRTTPDPHDGEIVRDATTGEPTGVLKEGAYDLLDDVLPRPSRAEILTATRRTIADLHQTGITAVQDAGIEPDEVGLWRDLLDEGSLRLRSRIALPMHPGPSLAEWRTTLDGYEALVGDLRGGPWLDAGILKGFVDGVIETRTAAMLAPYVDDDSTGRPEWEPTELDAFVAEADRRGWQVELHAIGDAAVRMSLDAFEHAANNNAPPARGRRHRVEHVEIVDRADVDRFGRLGVIASMQPYHADPSRNQTDVWAGNVGADRASQAWVWASIRRAGGVLAFGSDWNVVPYDPIPALHAAVNRQTSSGAPVGGWLPSEKLPLPEALSAYGHGSAYAAFAEDRRGTVKAGMDADIVVLDRDILAGGPSSILGTKVALTVVGGEVVHQSEDAG
jgi:hypothetical protein